MINKNILPSLVFLEDSDIEEIKLKGIDVLYCDKFGRNDYVYPYEIVRDALERWKEECHYDNSFRFIFARHPKDAFGDEEDYIYLAGLIDDLYLDENTKTLKADVTLLKTVFGQLIKYLLDKGIKVGTSIRGKVFYEPITIEKNINDRKVKIKLKKVTKLLLTGFDFVTFPSFIMTGASKEHVVKEKSKCPVSLVEDFIKDYHINNEDILCKLYGFCDLNSNYTNIKEKTKKLNIENNLEGGSKMGVLNDKDIEFLELKKQNLELEIDKLEHKKAEYEKLIDNLRKEKETNENELNKIRKEHEGLLLNIANLKKELEELKTELETKMEDVKEKARITEVEYKGKKYSLDEPPRIRIVKASEKVDETPWSDVDKNMIRKLVYLSQKSRIAKEAFGIVKDNWKEDWKNGLKYPHHVLIPSKTEGFDLDLVLNYDGLITAYKYMMGARGAGYYLEPEERRILARHLLRHFRELKKADYDIEVPEGLKNIAETTYILTGKNEIISNVFDTLIANGLIKLENKKPIDLDDDEIEFNKDVIDEESEKYILSKFAQVIFNTISEKTASDVFVNAIAKTYETWKENINKEDVFNKVKSLMTDIEGEKTNISQLLGIENNDQIINILDGIKSKLESDVLVDKLSGLERIKLLSVISALDSLEFEPITENFDDIETVLYFVSENFNKFSFVIENLEDFKSFVGGELTQQPQEQQTNTPTQQNPQPQEQQPQTSPMPEGETQPGEPTFEKTNLINDMKESLEDNILEKINNEEDEEMYKEKLEKIVNLLNEEFETEVNIDNIEEIVGKLISGVYKLSEENEELKNRIREVEFKEYKEQKKKELMKEGVSATTIENAFEKAKSVDDIDVISEILLNEVNELTSQTVNRKAKANVSKEVNKTEDKFERIFNRV